VVAGVLGVGRVVEVVVEGVESVEVVVVEVEVAVEVVCVIVGVTVLKVVVVSGPTATLLPQSWRARVWTVWAPVPRSDTSVGFTDPGRLAICVSRSPIALSALTQSSFDRSAEAVLSVAFSELASLEESRPELAPQAAKNAAARPSPAARRARGT
jgi:hypothetical protein